MSSPSIAMQSNKGSPLSLLELGDMNSYSLVTSIYVSMSSVCVCVILCVGSDLAKGQSVLQLTYQVSANKCQKTGNRVLSCSACCTEVTEQLTAEFDVPPSGIKAGNFRKDFISPSIFGHVMEAREVHNKHGRAMAQAVSRQPLTAEARFRSQVSPCEICSGQIGTGTGPPQSISVFPCQFHSTGAPLQAKTKKNNHLHRRVVQKALRLRCVRSFCCGALHKKKKNNKHSALSRLK
jgi:hypothetical protein